MVVGWPMSQHRMQLVHDILKSSRHPVPKQQLLDRLECSDRTLKRLFQSLRDDYNAPLKYDRTYNGYCYTEARFELNLPGFWATPHTLFSLVSMQKLLVQLRLDMLDPATNTLSKEFTRYLKRHGLYTEQLDRIRILPISARLASGQSFKTVANAVLLRQALQISYHARGSDALSAREVAPQRLVYYKDNWYLDAWCYHKRALRTFALDRIRELAVITRPCDEIDVQTLDQHFSASYGIFSGKSAQQAQLIFSADRARWVADEHWHPEQTGQWLDDGRYLLKIPYADDRELLMDIQRHLPEVEIRAPQKLRQRLYQHLQQSLAQHTNHA